MELTNASRLLKALGDDTRLRILNLLRQEELSGTDLMEILNMGQSRVSTQLSLLKEVGLVKDRRAGRRNFYSVQMGPQSDLLEQVLEEARESPEFDADRLGFEALAERRRGETRAYFDRVAAAFGEQILPGRTWEGLCRAMLHLAPRAKYVDLGIGDGLLTMMLAEIAEEVTAVDLSSEMLVQLEQRASAKGIKNIVPVEASIDSLPMEDAVFDVAVFSQALHHSETPLQALREAHRVLVPGGQLLVLDLLIHTEDWVKDKLKHRRLGFGESELLALIERAGFRDVTVQRAARDPHPPHFMTLVAKGVRV